MIIINILLISHYAGSIEHGMVYRHYYLAKEWVKMGHDVAIVASSFSHMRIKNPIVKKIHDTEYIDGIEYHWLKTTKYRGSGVGRIFNMLMFVSQLFLNGPSIFKSFNPDIVISSSTYHLDILPVYLLKKEKAKLILDIRDLWPLTPIELNNLSTSNPMIATIKKAEEFAYNVADKVVCTLPKGYLHMEKCGLDSNKFNYIPNGVDCSEWNDNGNCINEYHKKYINELRKKKHFLVCYAGAHGLANSLSDLIYAAKLLAKEPIEFILIGSGPEKENLIKMANKMNLCNVHFLPQVNKNEIPDILSLMDVLYIGSKKSVMYQYGISMNKIFDYMMAAKPVVMAIDASNDMIKECECGISIEPENPKDLANALLEIINMPESERIEMGINGNKYVRDNHTYHVIAKEYINLMEELLKS